MIQMIKYYFIFNVIVYSLVWGYKKYKEIKLQNSMIDLKKYYDRSKLDEQKTEKIAKHKK